MAAVVANKGYAMWECMSCYYDDTDHAVSATPQRNAYVCTCPDNIIGAKMSRVQPFLMGRDGLYPQESIGLGVVAGGVRIPTGYPRKRGQGRVCLAGIIEDD